MEKKKKNEKSRLRVTRRLISRLPTKKIFPAVLQMYCTFFLRQADAVWHEKTERFFKADSLHFPSSMRNARSRWRATACVTLRVHAFSLLLFSLSLFRFQRDICGSRRQREEYSRRVEGKILSSRKLIVMQVNRTMVSVTMLTPIKFPAISCSVNFIAIQECVNLIWRKLTTDEKRHERIFAPSCYEIRSFCLLFHR